MERKKNLKKATCLALILFSFEQGIIAADDESNQKTVNTDLFNATSIFQTTDATQRYLGLFSEYGTHRNGVGVEGDLLWYTDAPILRKIFVNKLNEVPESIGFSVKIDAIQYEKDFGIPGEKFTGELHLSALYSIGEANTLFFKYPLINGKRKHTIKFGYTGYLTTDTTSQITGQLDYSYINGRSAFLMNYENDTMLFYLTDKYRTAAFKMSYLYDLGHDVLGFSLGFNLWAGARKNMWEIVDGTIQISEEVNRENTVTLYDAKEYSVDVVYFSLLYNNYSLSFGYDSELFKEGIHNNIHCLLNDGHLPILDRPDRFYVAFKIGLPDDLF